MKKILLLGICLFTTPAYAAGYKHSWCVTTNSTDCTGDSLVSGSQDYDTEDNCNQASMNFSQINCRPSGSGSTCTGLSFDGKAYADVTSSSVIHMHTSCSKE